MHKRIRHFVALTSSLVACSSEPGALMPPGPRAGGLQPDASISDAGALCPQIGSAEDESAERVLQLGFALADTVLVGDAGRPAAIEDGYRVDFTITHVERGHAYLVGRRVSLELDARTARAGGFPQQFVVGLEGVGLPFDREATPLTGLLAAAPAERWPELDGARGFRAPPGARVAAIELLPSDDGRVWARRVETIAGESLPEDLVLLRGGYDDAARPAPGPQRYLITVTAQPVRSGRDRMGVSTVDFRRDTADARARVLEGLARPDPLGDRQRLSAEAGDYRLGWAFLRSARLVATQVEETWREPLANGAHVPSTLQSVSWDPDGGSPGSTFASTLQALAARCGDRRLVAADELVEATSDPEAGCERAAHASGRVASVTYAEIDDTPQSRARAQAWRAAAPALFPLRARALEGVPLGTLGAGTWSSTVSLLEAMVSGAPAFITPRLVSGSEARRDVELEVRPVGAPETTTMHTAFGCGDPRLTEVGRTWLGFLVGLRDPTSRQLYGRPLDRLVLMPGPLLDPEGTAARVALIAARRASIP